jgi:hypothetical protein
MKKVLAILGFCLSIIWTVQAQTPAATINGVPGPFTFTGSGVSQTGQTFTFSGGGGGSGTVSGQANGVIPLATAATVIGAQSHLSDNGTTVSSSEPICVGTCPSTGVSIGPLSTATNWNFDTTSAVTALSSIGGLSPTGSSAGLSQGSSSAFGVLKCGTGTTCASGVISATASSGWTNLSGVVSVSNCTFNGNGACVLGSDAASVTISSIPSGYTMLEIRAYGRTSDSSLNEDIGMTFNADTGAHYYNQFMYGNNTTATAGVGNATTSLVGINFAGSTATANVPQAAQVELQNYADTNFAKTEIANNARFDTIGTATSYFTVTYGGVWNSTSAISSITFTDNGGGNIKANSSFTIWGVK